MQNLSFHNSKRPISDSTYPLEYSQRIVEQFVEKYSRATTFLARKLGISPREFKYSLINLFRFQNNRWNSVRDVIKYVDRHDLYDYLSKYSYEQTVNYLTYIKYIVEDRLISEEFSRGRY